MANLIRFTLGDKIIYVNIVDNGADIIGLLKYELTEDMLLIHPTLSKLCIKLKNVKLGIY